MVGIAYRRLVQDHVTKKWHKLNLSQAELSKIIEDYTINLVPVRVLADRYGMSRGGIYRALKRSGIDTSNRGTIKVSCDYCQKVLTRYRSRIRKQIRNFCGSECYYSFVEHNHGAGAYKQNRHGQRIGRNKIATVFELKEGYTVHHKDKNCYNNRWDNLMVFATQGDHIRYHRLGPDYVTPIWVGDMSMPDFHVGHYTDNYTD